MNILLIATNFRPGGIQRHVLDLAAALRAQGHQVVLAGDAGAWQEDAAAQGDFVPLGLSALTWEGGGLAARLARLPGVTLALRRAIRQHRPDLIHAHETAPAMVARIAALGTGVPILMSYHGAAPAREAEVAWQGRHFADLVISPSRTALERLVAQGLPEARTRVIGLGVPPLPAADPARVAARRAELLAGAEGPLVFSLSRLSVQKGLDDMVRVARQIIDRHPGAVFAVAGGGPLADAIADEARAAGLAAQFRLIGPVAPVDVAEHLRASDVFLLTSRWENLPISIVEAFRAGLPVVATDCGGVRELVDDTVGALCPVGDVDAVVRAVDRILSDPAYAAQLGAAAEARSLEDRFDPDAVHARFAALYRDTLDHRPR